MTERDASSGAGDSEDPADPECHKSKRMCPVRGCEKRFWATDALRNHIKSFHKEYAIREFCCAECSYRTPQEDDLIEHILNTCDAIDECFFKCPFCRLKCKSNSMLQLHTVIEHLRGRRLDHSFLDNNKSKSQTELFKLRPRCREWICEDERCERRFTIKADFENHRSHHERREYLLPYSCAYCHVRFTCTWDLCEHVICYHNVADTTEIYYNCPNCEGSTDDKPSLVIHVNLKHYNGPEIDYLCQYCHFEGHGVSMADHVVNVHVDPTPR